MYFEGFILIGGRSSRMGEDKFTLILNGKSFLEIAGSTLKAAQIEKVSVVVGRSKPAAVAKDLPIVMDIYQNRGALGGIHSALIHSKSEFTFILACDYPFVSVELISFLMSIGKSERDFDGFAPIQADGKIQPLCAIYKTSTCRKILSEMLENPDQNYSVRDFLNQIKTRYIEFNEMKKLANAANFFFNVNSPEDLAKAIEISMR